MLWKKRHSNLIIATIFTIIYTVVASLILIGPLHINPQGGMYQLSSDAWYVLVYWIVAVCFNWGAYAVMKKRPESLFFVLMLSCIVFILIGIFLWADFGTRIANV